MRSEGLCVATRRIGALTAVCLALLTVPMAQARDSVADLWSVTHPLPDTLFDKSAPCTKASRGHPRWGAAAADQFRYEAILGTQELLIGLCLYGAGIPDQATHAFLKAKNRYVKGVQLLVDDARERQRALEQRRDTVSGISQGLSMLLSMPSSSGGQTQDVQGLRALVNAVSETELTRISEGMRELAAQQPASLTETVRIPVVPIAGFLKHIVRVEHGAGYCTGSFVGPRIVLTNLHCLPFGTTPSTLGVVRELVVASEKFTVKTWWTFRGEKGTLLQDETVSPCSRSYCDDDWALLELNETRIDADDYLVVAPRTPDLSTVMVAGYSGDVSRGAYLTLDLNCPVDLASSQGNRKRVTFQCSTFKGSSGSPVLSMFDQRVVVALNNSLWLRENTATTRGMTGAVRVELFAPKLYELLGTSPPAWADGATDSRSYLAHVRKIYEQRSKPLSLPSWDD
jgi:V8-like Glu-specific endopeptidase